MTLTRSESIVVGELFYVRAKRGQGDETHPALEVTLLDGSTVKVWRLMYRFTGIARGGNNVVRAQLDAVTKQAGLGPARRLPQVEALLMESEYVLVRQVTKAVEV